MADVWVLADDRAGNVGQCLGVAEALEMPFEIKEVRYGRLGGLPNLLRGASLTGVTPQTIQALTPPWPRIVIAAGRRTAPVARWIKRRSGAFLAQIMDPGPGGRGEFDLIAVPNHDGGTLVGANVLAVTGAPHRVTRTKLAEAAALWTPRFAALPRPWVAVIVGGSTRRRPFTEDMAGQLGARVAALAPHGSLLVTTSRRTGQKPEQSLLAAMPKPGFLHRWGQAGDNPYFGFLALADALVVTGDSVSMACEACGTDKPVYLYSPPGWVVTKHARLHAELFAAGFARALEDGTRLESWTHPALNAAQDIAAAIKARTC
jgi:mitochondrial fission protein ELM1